MTRALFFFALLVAAASAFVAPANRAGKFRGKSKFDADPISSDREPQWPSRSCTTTTHEAPCS